MHTLHDYPERPVDRSRWIVGLRGPKNRLDPWQPYAWLHEEERGPKGALISTNVVFLTNKECPFRCLMCDLWKNTLDAPVPEGAIPAQIRWALERLPPAKQIKLYNAGSFFDPRAVPPSDDDALTALLAPFERVIVESHPAFLGKRCLAFQEGLAGELEVAIGLETAHPLALERLNKRMTVQDFRRAARFLRAHHIALRVFLLVFPPFLDEKEGYQWVVRSMEIAFEEGATACCLIPTRGGNGAMEMLAAQGAYTPPMLPILEQLLEEGLQRKQGRVFVDLWDIERLATCACASARIARLAAMNREQQPLPSVSCPFCV